MFNEQIQLKVDSCADNAS